MAGLSRYGGAGSGREWIGGRGRLGRVGPGVARFGCQKSFCFLIRACVPSLLRNRERHKVPTQGE
jgi:hypothetical protein